MKEQIFYIAFCKPVVIPVIHSNVEIESGVSQSLLAFIQNDNDNDNDIDNSN